jgi:hypothetical protein
MNQSSTHIKLLNNNPSNDLKNRPINKVTMCTYRGDNKFSGKQTDGREHTIGEQRQRGEWVDRGIDVSKSLQAFQSTILPSTVSIPKRAMSTKRNLNGSKSPTQDLV